MAYVTAALYVVGPCVILGALILLFVRGGTRMTEPSVNEKRAREAQKEAAK